MELTRYINENEKGLKIRKCYVIFYMKRRKTMKHFIFDMGGVLLKEIQYDRLQAEDSFIHFDVPEEKEKFLIIWRQYQKGQITTDEFVTMTRPYFNKKDLTVEEYRTNFFKTRNQYAGPYEHAFALLKHLKTNGYKIYLLSNLNEVSFDYFASVFDLSIFDQLFLSFKIHQIKPEKEIYEYVIQSIQDSPKNMVFFDDKLANVEAAIKQGMYAYQTTGETLEKNINIARQI